MPFAVFLEDKEKPGNKRADISEKVNCKLFAN